MLDLAQERRIPLLDLDLVPWLPRPVLERPLLELVELPHAFQMSANLDGVQHANLQLRAASQVFEVEGRSERAHWCRCVTPARLHFSRRFHLREPVAVDDIEAHFEAGRLRVLIPKSALRAEPQPLRVVPLRECA